MPSWNLQSEQVFYAHSESIEGAVNTDEFQRYDTWDEAFRAKLEREHVFKVTQHVKVEMV